MDKITFKSKILLDKCPTAKLSERFYFRPKENEILKGLEKIRSISEIIVINEKPDLIYVPFIYHERTKSYEVREYAGYNGRDAVYDYRNESKQLSLFFGSYYEQIDSIFDTGLISDYQIVSKRIQSVYIADTTPKVNSYFLPIKKVTKENVYHWYAILRFSVKNKLSSKNETKDIYVFPNKLNNMAFDLLKEE